MSRVMVTVPQFLVPKPDPWGDCECRERPMETTYKTGRIFWLKEAGEAVAAGEAMCEVDIDKMAAEVPAPVAGVLAERCLESGDEFTADTVLAIIETAS